jgi:tRNA dimethylallyltransferase
MASVEPPLIVITGPTASGKTGLAIELAEKYGGEIICADSRTIYKGMNIGTAKPTADERARVLHYLLDVVDPGERYTAQDFQSEAFRIIDNVRKHGRLPFLVGGSGLYIDSVILDYDWPEFEMNDQKREELISKSLDELQAMIKKQRIDMPVNSKNKRHLVNALMRGQQRGKARKVPLGNTYVVAISTDPKMLEKRIHERAEIMFEQGVVDETKRLAEQYGWENEAMKSNIYPIIKRLLDGEITQQEAIDLFVIKDRQLAKRQVTWLRRHDFVKWLSLDEARAYLEQILDSGYASIEQV